MDITHQDNRMTIRSIEHFSLEQCLTCGQAFRWKKKDGGYAGVALGRAVFAQQDGDALILVGVDEPAGPGFIRYFDLQRDYGAIKQSFADDPFLAQGMAYAHGMRVLRQPVFETLISFIISANNNVKRITGIVNKLCRLFGDPIGDEFDFPTAERLASLDEEDLKACGAGYRARYIIDTAGMVADGFDLDGIADMDFEQARQMLTAFAGVGLKVADCVALYALGFLQAFPADVWMSRVLCGAYGYKGKNDKQMRAFVDETFGKHAGIAQQFLFHYARNNQEALCKP